MSKFRAAPQEPRARVNDIRAAVGHFELDPYMQLGHGDSAHGVVFGASHRYGQIAVKPFEREGRALSESRTLRKMQERGIDTFTPVDVAVGGLGAYLLTERRPDVRTHLGQLQWGESVASPRWRAMLYPAMHMSAGALADLHNKGITHGDFRGRNIARSVDTGGPVIFDAENASVDNFDHSFGKRAQGDVMKFGASLLASGLHADRSPSFRVGALDDEFAEPYLVDSALAVPTAIDAEELRTAVHDYWQQVARQGAVIHRRNAQDHQLPKSA